MKNAVSKLLFSGNPKEKSGNGFPWPLWRMKPALFGAGAVQSRTAGTQEGFPRCRAAFVADGNAPKVPVDARSRATAEPIGVTSGRGPHLVVQPSLGSAGRQCP